LLRAAFAMRTAFVTFVGRLHSVFASGRQGDRGQRASPIQAGAHRGMMRRNAVRGPAGCNSTGFDRL
jgi:hypothetical protein